MEPVITKDTIEVDNGGYIHIIFKKYIRLITSHPQSKSCQVYVVDMDDPITVPVSYITLKLKMGLGENDE